MFLDNRTGQQWYYIYGDGLLAMVTSGGALYCYHFDGTGHTVSLTDASKNVVNKYAYTPFGTIGNQQESLPSGMARGIPAAVSASIRVIETPVPVHYYMFGPSPGGYTDSYGLC